MSVKARIEDAEVLWQNGRREGAWILTLIAAAATSRKRYPQSMKDNEAFKAFMRNVMRTLTTGATAHLGDDLRLRIMKEGAVEDDETPPQEGDWIAFEDILYSDLRCYLVHEGRPSETIVFSESKIVNGRLTATFAAGSPMQIPDFWVLHLMKAVREAPENVAEFCQCT